MICGVSEMIWKMGEKVAAKMLEKFQKIFLVNFDLDKVLRLAFSWFRRKIMKAVIYWSSMKMVFFKISQNA